MIFYVLCVIAVLCGYLVGGVNPSIILSSSVYHQDIRKLGSGNPGFSNFKRVYGNKFVSWLVLFLDMAKTILPVLVFALIFRANFGEWQFGAALTGFACMLGHSFPVWYGFKGGKSFIAGFATTWFVDWRVALIFLALFIILLFTIKYMSFASICATASYPIALAFFHPSIAVEIIAILSALLVIWRHKANIKRLLNKTESKFSLLDKKKKTAEKAEGSDDQKVA